MAGINNRIMIGCAQAKNYDLTEALVQSLHGIRWQRYGARHNLRDELSLILCNAPSMKAELPSLAAVWVSLAHADDLEAGAGSIRSEVSRLRPPIVPLEFGSTVSRRSAYRPVSILSHRLR
jgi:hypothetical protein